MHTWAIYVGQRSDAGQCHMACAAKSIHHRDQVWSRSIKLQLNYIQLCHFIVEMYIWPLYVGQRSDTGQCHMTCMDKSIHHSHQVWSRSIKLKLNYVQLCHFFSEMHIWPINVGQRSDTGQCHMTCTGKSIHHSHQVWLRSIKLKLNYVQLCHFIVKCIFDP